MEKLKIFKKDNNLILIFIFFLLLAALLGYALETKTTPIRVAFETKGGGVVFDHQKHTALKDIDCQSCHHQYEEQKKQNADLQMKCRDCHYSTEYQDVRDDDALHKRLIGKNCRSCHTSKSVDCTFCHNAENFEPIVRPDEIKFETDGGQVKFNHLMHYSEDGLELECTECHHGYKKENSKTYTMSCKRCHYNTKYEYICENEDTHMRCIGKNCINCHTDEAENCEKCHSDE